MQIVNLNQDYSNISSYLSNTLLSWLDDCLKNNKKTILYLNKRWEYSSLICKDCNYIYKCPNCDVNLSIHKNPQIMLCHICSYKKEIDLSCEKCTWSNLIKVWVGTQQLERDLIKFFKAKEKEIKIYRFDTDNLKTVSSKKEVEENLDKADIIIWTKMINTGHDLENIWLIAVILLEQELSIPDYKSEERVYTNIVQLFWRWNRKWEETKNIIQTFVPENEVIDLISNYNYKTYFKKTLEERKLFKYPPFFELAILEYKNHKKEKSEEFILKIKNKLEIESKDKKNIEIIFANNYLKRKNLYIYKLILKWENLREFLECVKMEVIRNKWFSLSFE